MNGAGANSPPDAFGVYVHWPFCAAKCPYCDFNSHVRHGAIDQAVYARALAAELKWLRDLSGPRRVTSIFFGGGTPSLMQAETVDTILAAISDLWMMASDAEITLEANPTSAEAERFRAFARAGVNRASIGVQALDNLALRALGRRHSVTEALNAVSMARDAFARISFDLIYARPGQSPDEWHRELSEALALGPDHLSLYQLAIEAGTRFHDLHHAGKLALPDDEAGTAMFEIADTLCTGAGLEAYEVSNHARRGAECRHNLVYWRGQDYAGAGPGAHSRLSVDGVKQALSTEPMPERWLADVRETGTGVITREVLSRTQCADEFLLMGLRLSEGISPERYRAIAGAALDQGSIDELIGAKLLDICPDSGNIRASPAGRLVLNQIIANLSAPVAVPA